ncbi:MAG TPA: hypothetical protein VG095_04065 [Chthoniobacterales bacterium]|nr:hypothetical protein [Chthoniobacterales bacterium]
MNVRKASLTLEAALLLWFLAATVAHNHIGWADNCDYTRSMQWVTPGPVGFERNFPPEGTEEFERRFYNYWLPYWKLEPHLELPRTSALVLWLPGALLNYVFYSRAVLYLPAISYFSKALMFAFLVLALEWLRRRERGGLLLLLSVGVPLTLCLTTTSYFAYLNTFYQESAALVFLLLLCAALLLLKQTGQARYLLAALAALLLLSLAKMSCIYWPVLASPFIFYAWSRRNSAAWHVPVVAAVIVALDFTFIGTRRPLGVTIVENPYHRLFFGALVFSKDPAAQLRRLQLPDDMVRCVDVGGFDPLGRTCLKQVNYRVPHSAMVRAILYEPVIAWKMEHYALVQMQDISLDYLGLRVMSEAPPPHPYEARKPLSISRHRLDERYPFWDLWGKLKHYCFPRGTLLLAGYAALLGWFVWQWYRADEDGEGLAMLGCMCTIGSFIDMNVAIFGDGRMEMIKHLFLANVLFDLAAIAFVGTIALQVWSRRKTG